MAVDAGRPPRAAPLPSIPLRRRLYGFGSIYGKTVRDSRLAFIIMTGLISGLMLAVGSAWGTAYGTAGARQEIALLVDNVPPVIAGIAGPVVKPDTMGGFLTYKYGPFFAFLAGLWSILALSVDARRRGPAGQPRLRRRGAVRQAPDRAREARRPRHGGGAVHGRPRALDLGGRRSSALPSWGTRSRSPRSGSPCGSASWASSPGASRSPSRRSSAGGAPLASPAPSCWARSSSAATRHTCPRSGAIATLSWFHWTYDHVPLAGQYDWASLGLVAVVTVALFAVGVELFARRDLGVMTGIPVPGLPRATLGLRGPVGRAFGDQLPLALAWGIGIGVFGFMLAAVSRTFGE